MPTHSSRQGSLTSLLVSWADRPLGSGAVIFTPFHALVRLLFIVIAEFRKNDLALRSGALTYTVLLSLVPVLAMSTAVVKGLGGGDQLRSVAYSYIDTLDSGRFSIPGYNPGGSTETEPGGDEPPQTESSSITTHLRSAVDQLFAYVDKTNFATIGTIGVIGIFLSVILVLSNIEMAMNEIWHVADSRSITRKIFDYLALMVLIPISIIVAFAASAFLKIPTLASKFELLIPFAWLQTLILQLVPVFFIALTFYAIFIFFPNTRVKTIPALIGSTLAAVLWFGIQNLYISLQVGVSNYNAIYGSLATLPIFLIWMYLGWLFILGGAQVAYACQHLNSYRLTPVEASPTIRLSAAFDLITSVQDGFQQGENRDSTELVAQLADYDPHLIQDLLDELVDSGLLYLSADGIYLPAGPPEQTSHSRIIRTILGSSPPETAGGRQSEQLLKCAYSGSLVEPESGSVESSPATPASNLQDGQSST